MTNGMTKARYQSFLYVKILPSQAKAINDRVAAKTFKVIANTDNNIFAYIDTNTSRANIDPINAKLRNQKIGIHVMRLQTICDCL
jgi:hypothetical protein